MLPWGSAALLIAVPCSLALMGYDWIAIVLLGRGDDRLVPAQDLARRAVQDAGLAVFYALTVTPRVIELVAGYSIVARRRCLAMLGLGLAWYEVLCAFVTRHLAEPPGPAVSLVVLFAVPVVIAPWYVQWLRARIPQDR